MTNHERTGAPAAGAQPAEGEAAAERNGWTEEQGGKHSVKMVKPGHRPVTLPMHGGGDYSRDLTDQILREAGLKGGKK
ncbi:MAG TPA: type II toxin-antitoxin system HicA family toxin [Streptosporangiaceae bacterium]|nr:type II toxin-antitoxin system HicA family toxin [Streptosporangiaceae bacterium]